MKTKKLIIFALICALTIPVAFAAKPNVNNLKYTEYGKVFGPYYYVDTSQGPAKYYGEPVTIEYVCTNKWTITEKDRDGNGELDWVRFHYTHQGKAYVHDMDGNLIDTKPWTTSQTVVDDGIDATTRYGPTTSTTDPDLEIIYYLFTGPWENLEFMDYEWIIGGGVYHFQLQVHKGEITKFSISP